MYLTNNLAVNSFIKRMESHPIVKECIVYDEHVHQCLRVAVKLTLGPLYEIQRIIPYLVLEEKNVTHHLEYILKEMWADLDHKAAVHDKVAQASVAALKAKMGSIKNLYDNAFITDAEAQKIIDSYDVPHVLMPKENVFESELYKQITKHTPAPVHPGVNQLQKMFPGLNRSASCPRQGQDGRNDCHPMRLWGMIQHLNDSHKVSREWVADWLESLDKDKYQLELKEDNG